MTATNPPSLLGGRLVVFGLFAACFGLFSTTQTHAGPGFPLIDSEGFETYSLGNLEGQFAATFDGNGSAPWQLSPTAGSGPSTAVVQTATVESGSQALRVDRASGSDDRWAVEIAGAPSPSAPIVVIEWDQYTEQTVLPSGSFGPFFGIEAYDNSTSLLRVASLGVDSATGDVLVGASADVSSPLFPGALVETGAVVPFDTWVNFQLILDYTTDSYEAFVDEVSVASGLFEVFGANGADQFTDADIATLAAAGDAASLAATGTAFFDNYIVTEIPEPTSAALLSIMIGCGLAARRNLRVT